jgi:uncharacterized protein
MRFDGEGKLLRIFIGESDRFGGKPLYQAIVEKARSEGLAGATVLRGIEGFGASSHLHTSRILRLSEDLPVVVEIVDTAENLDRVLPEIDEMVGDGMMTLEKVEVITYRAAGTPRATVEERLKMLREQANATVPAQDETDANVSLAASVVAAHQYGASESQILEASGLTVEQVRAILEHHGS